MNKNYVMGGTLVLAVLAVGFWAVSPVTKNSQVQEAGTKQVASIAQSLDKEPSLTPEIVERHLSSVATSKDPIVQDQVAAIRMDSGYAVAKAKDFGGARKVFQTTVASYKGTGVRDESYGSIPDQAEYQAIVCLQAEGKTEEAIKEYASYIKERFTSPLCHGVHRRLSKLAPERQEEWDALLQSAVTRRENAIRLELAMCGPKALAYLASELKLDTSKIPGSKETPLYKRFSTVTKTTEEGTTMEQMALGLKTIGLESTGMMLNAKSFREQNTPFFLLGDSHYVLVIQKSGNSMVVYDPMQNSQREQALPPLENVSFQAAVLIPKFSTYQNRNFDINLPKKATLKTLPGDQK